MSDDYEIGVLLAIRKAINSGYTKIHLKTNGPFFSDSDNGSVMINAAEELVIVGADKRRGSKGKTVYCVAFKAPEYASVDVVFVPIKYLDRHFNNTLSFIQWLDDSGFHSSDAAKEVMREEMMSAAKTRIEHAPMWGIW